jgi:glycosyltransferase involved in cell wall biosynthesis/O-antigen/teichoic acid export membrane protein
MEGRLGTSRAPRAPQASSPRPGWSSLAGREQTGIRRNAGWLTLSTLAGGGLNFLYALALTWLLPPRQYPIFAGTQALLVVCGTAAAASVPWMLSQRLARTSPHSVRRDAIAFAVVLTAVQGVLAAVVVGMVASGLARGLAALPLVASTSALAIFAAATSGGYLQGQQRFGRLAVLLTAEVALKVVVGVLLVRAGAGPVGAIAGFGVGGLALVAVAAPPLLREFQPRLRSFGDRALWQLLLGLTGIQVGLVTLINLDLIVGSLIGPDTASLAGYQVAVILSRAPYYLASALSIAVFTKIASRHATVQGVMGSTATILVAGVIPVAIAVATLPPALARVFLPHSYPAAVEWFLPYTAAAGAVAALNNLATTFYQAGGRFRAGCALLGVGIGAEALACIVGLSTLSVPGLAYASLGSQALVAVLLFAAAVRFWGHTVLPRPWALSVAVAAAPLLVLRSAPAVWLAYGVGLCALVGWLALFRGRRSAPDPDATPAGAPSSPPRVYLLTAGPVSAPWDGGDTNLARVLVTAETGVDFIFLGQHGDAAPVRPGNERRELHFATGVPTPREQLRIFWSIGRERADVELVHLIITFGASRLKEVALGALPLIRRHPLVVTCPNGGQLPRDLLARASAVVALSRRTEARLRQMGLRHVHRVPPGIDLERFRPGSESEAQRRLSLAAAPSLFFAGHYDPGGGLDGALDVLHQLRPEIPSLRLLTAMRHRPGPADARERARVADRIDALGLAGAVVELGPAADVPLALQACRAVLFQPERVGRKMDLPMVLLEALASGRPIVVSPVDALPELADGSPAVAVEPLRATCAIEHLRRLLTGGVYAQAASAAARRLAWRRYSADAMVTAYADLYSGLLDRALAESGEPSALVGVVSN